MKKLLVLAVLVVSVLGVQVSHAIKIGGPAPAEKNCLACDMQPQK